MTTSKMETLIATLQRLEIELLGQIEDVPSESLAEMESAMNSLRATLQLRPSVSCGELESQLRERLRMQRAVEMLRAIRPAKSRGYAQPRPGFGFADLCEVAESAAQRFSCR